ncbi:sugar transferase [Actibacterium ureilyticum]|uniref:sugar transferase n=1 Tax=Actibacterium ureilyticum TaxID=1590614 RepID=UPI001FE3E812|nr:sugar transferase [Actibacterium ureilyticum]
MDVTLVIVTLPFTLPLVAVLAVFLFAESGNPFFLQRRLGRNGRVFRIWKLRTMVPDADARLKAYLEQDADAREEWTRTQKLKKDPRITPLGRFLRKTSLDELPQLWNVLRGDMSLVGPRPMMCNQRHMYPGASYYKLRPGITGAWQISDRNESEFKSRAAHDTRYDQDLSLFNDLRILAGTVTAVLRGTGY